MREPQTWTNPEPWTRYIVILWKAKTGPGETLPKCYKTLAAATKAAQNALETDRTARSAMIREEIIYRRTENSELSTSSPLYEIRPYSKRRPA